MNDLISRQALCEYALNQKDKSVTPNDIMRFPSAQPEQPTEVQDILQYLDEYLHPIVSPEHWSVYSELYDMVSMLQSSQPERQRGEWIDYAEDGYVECPFCHSATNCDGNKDELHFCFSCGADMRGE